MQGQKALNIMNMAYTGRASGKAPCYCGLASPLGGDPAASEGVFSSLPHGERTFLLTPRISECLSHPENEASASPARYPTLFVWESVRRQATPSDPELAKDNQTTVWIAAAADSLKSEGISK
jgi:hypothetical protein